MAKRKTSQLTLKDNRLESQLFNRRLTVMGVLVLGVFSFLLIRYFVLQIIQYQTYATYSENNRVHLETVPPSRGFIFDRNGILLADNRPTFTLSLNRQVVPNIKEAIAKLTPILKLTEDDLKRFNTRLRVARKFEDVPVKLRLTEEDIARFSEVKYEIPGVEIKVELSRYYPYNDLFAHVIGYVSRISEKEAEKLDPVEYDNTNLIGKIGVEKYYENILHGKAGYRHVETNAHGKLLRVLKNTSPKRGNDLTLHLDYQLQKIASDQLKGRRGAVVAIDPNTGGVLAFVSNPSFDPNAFVGGISYNLYTEYRDHLDKPLYNRALQGIYPPGSTIKPFAGLGGLNYKLIDWQKTISDPGYFRLPGDTHQFRDWKKEGHGAVDLHKAIVQSCDTFFYQLSDNIGVDRFNEWMSLFGFGKKTGIDLMDEKTGTLPSTAWKRNKLKAPWYRGEMMSVGIGQGYFTATPLQIATATAIVANGGRHITPHLLQKSIGPKDYKIKNAPDYVMPYNGDPGDWQKMKEAMRDVVHGEGGTARATGFGITGYEMAGKTGTAQVKGIKQGERYNEAAIGERFWDHGWFVGFAPYENPQIAVAVLIENGRHGSSVAPIARALFDYKIKGVIPTPAINTPAGAVDE